eukprot:9983514-Ditylum_brightwellii.AAC.1
MGYYPGLVCPLYNSTTMRQKRLQASGLKVNMGKSFSGKKELEYLGYWITREGIMPQPNKVTTIHERRAEKLAPLSVLTSKKAWKWTEVEQQAFETEKAAVAKNTLLVYQDLNRKFEFTLPEANISWE